MPREKKKRIMHACAKTNIKFLQAAIIRDEKDDFDRPGNVVLIPVDEFGDFLDMSDFITEKKYAEQLKKPPIRLNDPSDLPYYQDNPGWVEQFIENRKRR